MKLKWPEYQHVDHPVVSKAMASTFRLAPLRPRLHQFSALVQGGDHDGPKILNPPPAPPLPPPAAQFRRFHGSVRVDSARVGRDAGRIADEVIAHLAVGAEVTVTIEIEASCLTAPAISSCAP
jgi:hypothetical protein